MRLLPLMFAFGFALLCGCASRDQGCFVVGKGDVGQFILLQAVACGGNPITTNGLPNLTSPWRYAIDDYGVVIRMPRGDFDAVEKLLHISFGKPRFGPSNTAVGGKLGGYRLTPQGGSIQFSYDAGGTQVILLRPLTQREFDDAFIGAMKMLEIGRTK